MGPASVSDQSPRRIVVENSGLCVFLPNLKLPDLADLDLLDLADLDLSDLADLDLSDLADLDITDLADLDITASDRHIVLLQ